jgi:hypothetical protein
LADTVAQTADDLAIRLADQLRGGSSAAGRCELANLGRHSPISPEAICGIAGRTRTSDDPRVTKTQKRLPHRSTPTALQANELVLVRGGESNKNGIARFDEKPIPAWRNGLAHERDGGEDR